MPDDLTKKISNVLNNKPISPEDDLAFAIDEMARDIAMIEPNSVDWEGWVSYLLQFSSLGYRPPSQEIIIGQPSQIQQSYLAV